ncbi:MAG: non-heme iron oxygenase ferredoxin subunit [Dehalococcoidia bacterium]|nr:non-heme iron oxygenase ferredoxin subunit [Dehalococcoidia bacterium]
MLGPADVADGETRDYQVEGHSILVANCGGELWAIEDRCTHDNGPLAEGRLYRCEIECPRHGAKFDMKTGRATALPAFLPVAAYPLRVVDGQIEVQLVPPPQPRY